MALDLQNIFATPVYIPYERPPDSVALWTAIPRGLFSFVVSAALDAKAIGDEALVSILGTLPPNFAYVMEGAHWNIVQNRAFDWEDRVNLNLQNFFRSPVNTGVALTANYAHGSQTNAQNSQTRSIISSNNTEPWPSFPMVAPDGTSGVAINFSGWNNDTVNATTVGTINFWISFWQFDLEQIRKYPINSPLPVQAR